MHPLRTPLLLGALGVATLSTGIGTGVAHADDTSATGPKGQTLTVSKSTGLSADGETLKVTGKGYDQAKGIYVAFCKDNGPGKVATPCGGGADTTGKAGGSQWVSSNPPPYGKGLAVPYGSGGSFSLSIKIKAQLSDAIDCTKVKCVVTTRADHTRASDRSQDVHIPVTFGGSGSGSGMLLIGGAAAGIAVIAIGGGVVVARRRAAAPKVSA